MDINLFAKRADYAQASNSFAASPLVPNAKSIRNSAGGSHRMSPSELKYQAPSGKSPSLSAENACRIISSCVNYNEVGPKLYKTYQNILIPRAIIRNSREGDFAEYEISVETELCNWTITRRFREFNNLHSKLAKEFHADGLQHQQPQLPAKRYFGSSTSPTFVQERRVALQDYLKQVCSCLEYWSSESLLKFLDTNMSIVQMQAGMIDLLMKYKALLEVSEKESLHCGDPNREFREELLGQAEKQAATQKEEKPTDDAFKGTDNREEQSQITLAINRMKLNEREEKVPSANQYSMAKSLVSLSGRMSSVAHSVGSYYPSMRPTVDIDMSDLDNLVKRVNSYRYLGASHANGKEEEDDDDDGVDDILMQHYDMNNFGPYSLGSYANISQSPTLTGYGYPLNNGDAGLRHMSVENDFKANSRAGAKGVHHTSWEAPDANNSVNKMLNFGLLGLQRGSSIVGDPDDPLFQVPRSSQSVSKSVNINFNQSRGKSESMLDRSAWMASGSSFGIPGMNIGGIGISLGDEAHLNGKGQAGPWNVTGGLFLMTGEKEKTDHGLPLEMIPRNTVPLSIDRRVEDLIDQLRPSSTSLEYRRSVFNFVAKLVKKALGAQCFPVGGYALKTFLPDEEVGISAFLCHGQENTWFIRVNETLCKASASIVNKVELTPKPVTEMHQPTDTFEHKLSNVNFVNLGHMQRIKCVVDNQVAVDISANQLEELCMVAFEEEIDRLIGKNCLFKRSLLLIKAWWLYESRAYTGTNMMACISEPALIALIIAVLNRHHRELHTPLQVMAMFFRTYANFDWSTYCVGIDGDRLRSEVNMGETWAPIQSPSDPLISQEMLRCYQERCRHNGNASGSTSSVLPEKFVVRQMNIMNPLNPNENLIAGIVNTRRAQRVIRLFQITANNMQPVLQHLKREITKAQRGQQQPPSTFIHTTSVTMLDTFFSLSWSRFGQGWRPDVPPQFDTSAEDLFLFMDGKGNESKEDPLGVDLNEVWDNIKYCSFLLDAEVTDSALFTLSKEIIQEKGPLPVGEIGKLLQEFTANPGLSQTLKDQFGGLKKFLEKFPNEFLISTDHQFNPHVYLRSAMTNEEIDSILNGGAGSAPNKKGRKNANRKQSSSQNKPFAPKLMQPPPNPFPAVDNVTLSVPPGMIPIAQYGHYAPQHMGVSTPHQVLPRYYDHETPPPGLYPMGGFRQPSANPYRNLREDMYYNSGAQR